MNNAQKFLIAILTLLLISGCASFAVPVYSPDYQTIDRLKKVDLEKMSIGEVGPRDPDAEVNQITLRGATLKSPNGTFASYLENAIRSDLIEMGFYDPKSTTRIDAIIFKNDMEAGVSTGHGVMEVMWTIKKEGVRTFEKVYVANIQFESAFVGGMALDRGLAQYPNLVRALLRNVYGDPAFIKAVKK